MVLCSHMEARLKIGITCYPTFGGSGVIATELGLALAKRGHEVHFITSRLPARLHGYAQADVSFHEVNVYNYALFRHEPYTLALAAKMAEVAETFELDLLHVHYAIPHAISAHLAQEMLGSTLKVITTLHGTDITLVGNDPSLYKITRFAIEQADALTAVSEWLRNETEREFSPSIPVHVIRNFIDPAEFTSKPGADWSGERYCARGTPNLIHVSNFRPVKRAPDVISIFAKVLKQQEAHLLMVGDGPDLPGAVMRARELNLMDHVQFLGNREDVASLLASSDIVLLPSESESFGLSALEGMACGCAVIASKIGGLPELVRQGEDGYLCDLGDTDSMAAYALELLGDKPKLQRMQAAARQRALETFSVDAVVQEYIALYKNVLTGAH
jgi:L-malate glycosyltransferase